MKRLLPVLLLLLGCSRQVPPVPVPVPPQPPPVVAVEPGVPVAPVIPQFILNQWPNARSFEGIYYAGSYDGVPVERLPEWFAEAGRRVLTVDPGPLPDLRPFLVTVFMQPDCDDPQRFHDQDGNCVLGHAYGNYVEASSAVPNVVIHEAVHEFWLSLHPTDVCEGTRIPVWYCVEHGPTNEKCRTCDPFMRR